MSLLNDIADVLKSIKNKHYSILFISCVFGLFFCLSVEPIAIFFKVEKYIGYIRLVALALFIILIYYKLDTCFKKREADNKVKKIMNNLTNQERTIVEKIYQQSSVLLPYEMGGVRSLVNKGVVQQTSIIWHPIDYQNNSVQGYYFELSEEAQKYIDNKNNKNAKRD